MTTEDFYKQQSAISNPGDFASLYDAIPDDIAGICRTVQGLVVHYFAGGFNPPAERICEIDTRHVSAILRRILEMDDRPLTEARPIEKRFIGCCRDFTMLTVSILRHKGIPARARYGTGAYFEKGYYMDHVIVEHWDGSRWVGVDSQMDAGSIQYLGIAFDVLDVPQNQFLTGGRGWLMARKEGVDPNRFGLGSGSPINGWDFIIAEMILDLAALNRLELLCWDMWGAGTMKYEDLSEEDKLLLDRVAQSTLDNSRFEEWQTLFQHEKLHVPAVIHNFSPAVSPDQHPVLVQLSL